jgi:hypothetical protein
MMPVTLLSDTLFFLHPPYAPKDGDPSIGHCITLRSLYPFCIIFPIILKILPEYRSPVLKPRQDLKNLKGGKTNEQGN